MTWKNDFMEFPQPNREDFNLENKYSEEQIEKEIRE